MNFTEWWDNNFYSENTRYVAFSAWTARDDEIKKLKEEIASLECEIDDIRDELIYCSSRDISE